MLGFWVSALGGNPKFHSVSENVSRFPVLFWLDSVSNQRGGVGCFLNNIQLRVQRLVLVSDLVRSSLGIPLPVCEVRG